GVRGDLVLAGGALQFRNVSAYLAGGELRVEVVYNLRDPARSFFTLALSGADSRRLFQAVYPDLVGEIDGPVDRGVRGRIGREWHGGGQLVLTRGKVTGAEVSEWRAPFDFVFSPSRGQGEVVVRESGAQVGGGRATLRATLTWGAGGLRVEGD